MGTLRLTLLSLLLSVVGGCRMGGSDTVQVNMPVVLRYGLETPVTVDVTYVHDGGAFYKSRLSNAVCNYRLDGQGDYRGLRLRQVKQKWQGERWMFSFPAFDQGQFVEYYLEFDLSGVRNVHAPSRIRLSDRDVVIKRPTPPLVRK